MGPRVLNSIVWFALSGVLGTLIALALAVVAAIRRGKLFDHTVTAICLATYALPEFVVGIALVFLLATVIWHILPSVSVLPPATRPWGDPQVLVLPVATLIIVIVPYVFRMARATLVDALDSEYARDGAAQGLVNGTSRLSSCPTKRDSTHSTSRRPDFPLFGGRHSCCRIRVLISQMASVWSMQSAGATYRSSS